MNTNNIRQTVDYLKSHKEQITPDILEKIRSVENGKHLALEVLELPKNDEGFFVDAFGHKISFNGNRRLKKEHIKLALAPIHILEMKRCKEDIHYYYDNYVKIQTRNGLDFPTPREYQRGFIEFLRDDSNDDVIGLMGRQSGKSVSTGIYLSHLYTFHRDIKIGIVANRGKSAREFLEKTKSIIQELPMWMQQGSTTWNKGSIINESRTSIETDVPSSDAFRGSTMNVLVIDECVSKKETITIRNDETGEIETLTVHDFYDMVDD